MATFESGVHTLAIEPHPDADRLELAVVGGLCCVVGKGAFRNGQLAAYIPERAVCPDRLIAELGLEGKLAGARRNRVKAMKLRGTLSLGLVYPVRDGRIRGRPVSEGDDVTELLELAKYEPPIPIAMQGEVRPVSGATVHYDIENILKYPDAFSVGEAVLMTEKLHGSWCCLGWHPEHGVVVTSKGMSEQGKALHLNDANAANLYVGPGPPMRSRSSRCVPSSRRKTSRSTCSGGLRARVQDLHYGEPNPALAVFDAYLGEPRKGRYLAWDELAAALADRFRLVPVLYRGPFSRAALAACTDGQTALGGGHLCEGAVVRPLPERHSAEFGRVILKSVSGDYLTRKGGTEDN